MNFAIIQVFITIGMLATGTIDSTSMKLMMQTCAPGFDYCPADSASCPSYGDQRVHSFSKPLLIMSDMFLGEATSLVLLTVYTLTCGRKIKKDKNERSFKDKAITVFKHLHYFLVFAICDTIQTSFATYGLIFVPTSVYLMFRGSIVIFTSIWTVCLLHVKFRWWKWASIIMVIIGLLLIGVSGMLNNSLKDDAGVKVDAGKYFLGIVMIITGQISNSFQMVMEEKLMKRTDIHPLIVCGSEGVIGFLIAVCILFPIASNIKGNDCTKFENTLDAFKMMSQNSFILTFFIIYYTSITIYSTMGLQVTKLLSAIHRNLIDTSRTIVVWIVSIIIGYSTNARYGELWEKYTWIQLIGFLFLAMGTLIYNGVVPMDRIEDWIRKKLGLRERKKENDEKEKKEEKKEMEVKGESEKECEGEGRFEGEEPQTYSPPPATSTSPILGSESRSSSTVPFFDSSSSSHSSSTTPFFDSNTSSSSSSSTSRSSSTTPFFDEPDSQ